MYYYVSAQKDLYSQTYSSDSATGFAETLTGVNKKGTTISTTDKIAGAARSQDYLIVPNNIAVSTDDPAAVSNSTVYLNRASKTTSNIRFEAYITSGGQEYVAAAADPATGNLVNTSWYDYYQYEYTTKTLEDLSLIHI